MAVALVTGASTGIGLETALLFARRGYRVYAGARNPSASEGLVRAVADGLPVVPVALDVDSDDSVRETVQTIGTVDILVNNAGIASAAPIEHMPLDEVRALFETNVFGVLRMLHAVLPSMRARRAGVIVNVSSVMGRLTLPCHGAYAATKFALGALSESLAMEMAPFGVRVVLIEPGVVLTPIWGKREVPLPPEHAYGAGMARLWRLLSSQMEDGTTPDIVAEAIHEAATRATAHVHIPVGADAEVWVRGREGVSADHWVALLAEPNDTAFVARATETFGVDVLSPPSMHARTRRRRSAATGPTMPMTVDELRAFAASYTAAWCSHDPAQVAACFEVDGALTINGGIPAVGRQAIAADAGAFMTTLPDLVVTMDSLEREDDRVIYRWTLMGTSKGPDDLVRSVRISGQEAWEIGPSGLIADSRGQFDAADYDRQLHGSASAP